MKNAYLCLIASMPFFCLGEYLSKVWSMNQRVWLALVIGATYLCSTFMWLLAMRIDNRLAILGTAWSVMATATTVLMGTCAFHEKLNVWNWAGVVMSLAAIALLQKT